VEAVQSHRDLFAETCTSPVTPITSLRVNSDTPRRLSSESSHSDASCMDFSAVSTFGTARHICCVLLGQLFDRVDLIKLISNVRHVRLSTKILFDFNEIWRVGRGRRVMHDGMQYDPIQGQGQGIEPFKVVNPAICKSISFAIYNGS